MVATTTESPVRLIGMEVENLAKVRHIDILINGGHVLFSGPNNAGKSTLGMAVWAGIVGLSKKQYPEPVHHGADHAIIWLDLGEFKVERKIFPGDKRDKLKVTRRDGSPVPDGPSFLKSLVSAIWFDPGKFLEKRPQDQVDDVLRLCGVVPPVESVRKLTDETHLPRDGESAAAYLERLSGDPPDEGLYYRLRREKGQVADQKLKALEEQREIVKQFGELNGGTDTSASELLGQIETLNHRQDQRREAIAEARDARNVHVQATELLQTLHADKDTNLQQQDAVRKQIEDLKARLQGLEANGKELADRITKGESFVKERLAEAESLEAAVARLPDQAPEISRLRSEVQTIERTNEQRVKRRMASEQLVRLEGEAETAKSEHKQVDDILDGLRYLRRHLLDGAKINVPGLEIGDGELRLGGVPLAQAGNAEKGDLAMSLAMYGNEPLKIIRLENAECMDPKRRDHILRRATERGYQVIMMVHKPIPELEVEVLNAAA
jgi:hypothetical protein